MSQTPSEPAAAPAAPNPPTDSSAVAPNAEPVAPAAPAAPESGLVTPDPVAPAAPVVPPGDDPHAWAPEKHRVLGADGKLDAEATGRKLGEAYRALEAKLGKAADLPPPSVADYKLETPTNEDGTPKLAEGVDFAGFVADPLFQGFLERAHAKGLTNAQAQFIAEEYLTVAPELLGADKRLTASEARAELGKLWGEPAVLDANLGHAKRAMMGFGGENDAMPGSRKNVFDKFGSDPDFIAFAARIGAEMREDAAPGGVGVPSALDVDAMMRSEAYMNPQHPEHARTKAKVKEHFDRTHGTAPRKPAGGAG